MRIVFFLLAAAFAQGATLIVPPENLEVVEGFQDGFNSKDRKPQWVAIGPAGDIYLQENGVIQYNTGALWANHLVLQMDYDLVTQEILARIRVLETHWGDAPRGGLGLSIDSGGGLNFFFRYNDLGSQSNSGTDLNPGVDPFLGEGNPTENFVSPLENNPSILNHVELHNEGRAWGPELYFPWQKGVYYWVRFRHEVNKDGGAGDLFAKIWKADGQTAEPANWQVNWNYTPRFPIRSGLVGLTASGGNAPMLTECDYVLIKAAGLPKIMVGAPEILNLAPSDGVLSHAPEEGIRFGVNSPFDLQSVEFFLNDTNLTAELQSVGNASEKSFVYSGLESEKQYQVRIKATSVTGGNVQTNFTFGTFKPVTELRIVSPGYEEGRPTFYFAPLPGKTAFVQFRASLDSGDWEPAPVVTASMEDGLIQVTDPTPEVSGYYRVMAQ